MNLNHHIYSLKEMKLCSYLFVKENLFSRVETHIKLDLRFFKVDLLSLHMALLLWYNSRIFESKLEYFHHLVSNHMICSHRVSQFFVNFLKMGNKESNLEI